MKTSNSCVLVLISFVTSLVLSGAAHALSLEEAAAAAKSVGFEDKVFPKTGESYVTTKTISKKKYSQFKTFPKSKKNPAIEQITLSCNQCESKKISEADSIACYEDVQALAQKLKVDLPGGVIKSFENPKSQQQSWDLKDKSGKSLRFTRTQVKCAKVSSEGLKFDFFFR